MVPLKDVISASRKWKLLAAFIRLHQAYQQRQLEMNCSAVFNNKYCLKCPWRRLFVLLLLLGNPMPSSNKELKVSLSLSFFLESWILTNIYLLLHLFLFFLGYKTITTIRLARVYKVNSPPLIYFPSPMSTGQGKRDQRGVNTRKQRGITGMQTQF